MGAAGGALSRVEEIHTYRRCPQSLSVSISPKAPSPQQSLPPDRTFSPALGSKEVKPINPKRNDLWIFPWKGWCWSRSFNTLATWCEEPTHWKRPWSWERLKAGRVGDDRGWDGWMASLTHRHELEQAPGVGDKQRSLEYCSSWSPPKSRRDLMTQQQQH